MLWSKSCGRVTQRHNPDLAQNRWAPNPLPTALFPFGWPGRERKPRSLWVVSSVQDKRICLKFWDVSGVPHWILLQGDDGSRLYFVLVSLPVAASREIVTVLWKELINLSHGICSMWIMLVTFCMGFCESCNKIMYMKCSEHCAKHCTDASYQYCCCWN